MADTEGELSEDNFSVRYDFSTMSTLEHAGVYWKNDPASANLEEGVGLRVIPKSNTDFWCKTFREPTVKRTSGHALLHKVPDSLQTWCVEVVFTLNPQVRYDQAGVMVYVDGSHWLKAGIEVEGGKPRMSCVVTDRESDWNYLTWPCTDNIQVRIHGAMFNGVCECKVEYLDEGKHEWCFLREGPISLPKGASMSVGCMCCAPKKEGSDEKGMDAVFRSFTLSGSS